MKREEVNTPENAVAYMLEHYSNVFNEGYVIEATVEVVIGMRGFRLEAYKQCNGPRYDVHYWEIIEGRLERFWSGPWCDRTTATEALMQAMSFLYDSFQSKETRT